MHEQTDVNEIKAPEAPSSAKLGQYAFATERTDDVPPEQNTQAEKKLYARLSAFLNDGKMLDKRTILQLYRYIRKGWYRGVIKAPKSKKIYRGLSMPSHVFRATYGLAEDDTKGFIEKSQSYVPKHGASSWTTNKTVALISAKPNPFAPAPGIAQIVLHAYVHENPNRFIVGRGGMYKVDGLDETEEKNEVIGLGKIRVFRSEYVIND